MNTATETLPEVPQGPQRKRGKRRKRYDFLHYATEQDAIDAVNTITGKSKQGDRIAAEYVINQMFGVPGTKPTEGTGVSNNVQVIINLPPKFNELVNAEVAKAVEVKAIEAVEEKRKQVTQGTATREGVKVSIPSKTGDKVVTKTHVHSTTPRKKASHKSTTSEASPAVETVQTIPPAVAPTPDTHA